MISARPATCSPSTMPTAIHLLYSAPVHRLPVELLARIFVLGVISTAFDGDSPFLIDPETGRFSVTSSSFQIFASQTCRSWREIALNTPSLWTTIHFRRQSDLQRAQVFLARSTNHLLDITVDTVAQQEHIPPKTICSSEVDLIFSMLTAHLDRWRSFHLGVRDNECKASARKHLSTCGPAHNLETLQLYHFENFKTPHNLHLATHRPPVTVFGNELPLLRNVSLIGVNLPWAHAPFLTDLKSLELALHADFIRPSYEQWQELLQRCPGLESLSLYYSGPAQMGTITPGPIVKIGLPNLLELKLKDLDEAYLMFVLQRLHLPRVKTLFLHLGEQNFSPFVWLLLGGNTHASDPDDDSSDNSLSPFPSLDALETLVIPALECDVPSWRAFIQALKGVVHIDVDFGGIIGQEEDTAESHFNVLFADSAAAMLPRLATAKFAGVTGSQLSMLIKHRAAKKYNPVKWIIRRKKISSSPTDEAMAGEDVVLNDLVEAGHAEMEWVDSENDDSAEEYLDQPDPDSDSESDIDDYESD